MNEQADLVAKLTKIKGCWRNCQGRLPLNCAIEPDCLLDKTFCPEVSHLEGVQVLRFVCLG